MGKIVCVANQKGGVGKTTTAVNLAVGAAKSGARTLLIDLDPQCNATTGLGLVPTPRHPLITEQPLWEALLDTYLPELKLLPGSRSFQDTDLLARGEAVEDARLKQHLQHGLGAFEWVFIDCPPSLGPLTQTALTASHEVLMPIQCEYYAMEGLSQMVLVIRDIIRRKNSKLEFGGVVLTMYDPTLELTHEVHEEVREYFGDVLFETVIPRDVAVCEAPSHGRAVLDYAPRSRGARAYLELCLEVLKHE